MPLKMQNNDNYLFQIEKIQVMKFSIATFSIEDITEKKPPIFQISTGFFLEAEEVVGNDFVVEVFDDETLKQQICNLTTRILYKVKDFKPIYSANSNIPDIPEPLVKALLRFTISTVRGIFFVKTEGTLLNNVYLPPIDISKMVNVQPENSK